MALVVVSVLTSDRISVLVEDVQKYSCTRKRRCYLFLRFFQFLRSLLRAPLQLLQLFVQFIQLPLMLDFRLLQLPLKLSLRSFASLFVGFFC